MIAMLRGACVAMMAGWIMLGHAAHAALPDERPRVALVIGNSDYADMPLINPVNDADLMSATLKTLGFEIIDLRNATFRDMRRAVRDFTDKLADAGDNAVSLVYYAGHGMQVGGRNYLIPVDAVIEREADVDVEGFAADSILSAIEYSETALNIVILDACRNNPFARSFRSGTKGLARMDAPRGTLLAYATAPGDVAADGAGTNSPYTSALVSQMSRPGLSVEQLFKTVRVSVMQETGERQVPWESSSLTGEFYFGGEAASQAGAAPAMTADVAAWSALGSSQDAGVLQSFVDQFPDSPLAPIAKARIASLAAGPAQLASRSSARPRLPHQQYDGMWAVEYQITESGSKGSAACQSGAVLSGELLIADGNLNGNVKSSRAGNAALKGAITEDGKIVGTALGWDWRPQGALDVRLQEEGGKLVGTAANATGAGDCSARIVMTRLK